MLTQYSVPLRGGFLCIGLDMYQHNACGAYASPTNTQLLLYPSAAALYHLAMHP